MLVTGARFGSVIAEATCEEDSVLCAQVRHLPSGLVPAADPRAVHRSSLPADADGHCDQLRVQCFGHLVQSLQRELKGRPGDEPGTNFVRLWLFLLNPLFTVAAFRETATAAQLLPLDRHTTTIKKFTIRKPSLEP